MADRWTQKMTTYFKRIDFDHDGSVTRADFEGMAKRFCEKLDAAKGKALTAQLLTICDTFLSGIGAGASIKEAEFVTSMKKLVEDPGMKAKLEAPLPLFFHVIDTNNDGLISKEEYGVFFNILGLADGLSDTAFIAIDTDKDGNLSEQEFVTAGSDFFLNKSGNHPSDIFWGPLV